MNNPTALRPYAHTPTDPYAPNAPIPNAPNALMPNASNALKLQCEPTALNQPTVSPPRPQVRTTQAAGVDALLIGALDVEMMDACAHHGAEERVARQTHRAQPTAHQKERPRCG